jgi:hypothetical protein
MFVNKNIHITASLLNYRQLVKNMHSDYSKFVNYCFVVLLAGIGCHSIVKTLQSVESGHRKLEQEELLASQYFLWLL